MAVTVTVQDFQSLDNVSIVIDGLTVITGTNNSGKSALFRAIKGAFENTRGYSFVKHGKSMSRVNLEFSEDSRSLCWEKGKGVNNYTVDGSLGFSRVGTGVPEEVSQLGVRGVETSYGTLWPQVASQFTGVSFLVDAPGSHIAEAVADVGRMGQLSKALKLCEKDKRKVSSEISVRTEDLSSLTKRQEEIASLKFSSNALDAISSAEDALALCSNRLEQSQAFLSSLFRHGAYISRLSWLSWAVPISLELKNMGCRLEGKLKELSHVATLEDKSSSIRRKVSKLDTFLDCEWFGLNASLEGDLDSLQGLSSQISEVSALRRRLIDIRAARDKASSYVRTKDIIPYLDDASSDRLHKGLQRLAKLRSYSLLLSQFRMSDSDMASLNQGRILMRRLTASTGFEGSYARLNTFRLLYDKLITSSGLVDDLACDISKKRRDLQAIDDSLSGLNLARENCLLCGSEITTTKQSNPSCKEPK